MADDPLRQQITDLIRQKTSPRLSAIVEQSVKESLMLRTTSTPDDQIAVGQSKLGGLPDLPPDAQWPAWRDKHLSFVAQINLSDLPSLEFLKILPNSGILSFFYHAEQKTWGFDPDDKGSWRVLHFEQQDLHRRTFPLDLQGTGIYKSCSLESEVSFTLPAIESPHVDLEYGPEHMDEIRQYIDLMESFGQLLDGGSCIHRLLGHPDLVQGDLLLEAQLVSHGLYCGDATGYQDPRRAELESGAADWGLLLQIDSDDNAGMMWGDLGRIYYLMTSEHMKTRDFDAAWMVLQCS